MSTKKFSYANPLVDCATVHFARLGQTDPDIYNQYLVCARFFDVAGHEYWVQSPEMLAQSNLINGLTLEQTPVAKPTATVWRAFKNEDLVKGWLDYRVNEAIVNTERKLIIQASMTGGFEDGKAKTTLQALRDFKKELTQSRLQQAPIMMFYAAPLNGPLPNGVQLNDGFGDDQNA